MASNKRSLYKSASPVNVSRHSSTWQQHSAEEPSFTRTNDDSVSSPRRAPPIPSPSPLIPTHSPSLSSLNSSPPETANIQPPIHRSVTSPELKTSGKPVMVISAGARQEKEAQSAEVWVTTSQVPSPVRVVRHWSPHSFPPPPPPPLPLSESKRRFSSNFTSCPAGRGSDGVGERSGEIGGPSSGCVTSLSLSHHLASEENDHSSGTDSSGGLDQAKLALLEEGGEEEGIRRSASDEAVTSGRRESRVVDTSVHSRSVELSTIREEGDQSSSQLAKKKKPKKGRVVPSRYMTASSNFKKPPLPLQSRTSGATKVTASLSKKTRESKPPSRRTMEDSFGPVPLSSSVLPQASFHIPAAAMNTPGPRPFTSSVATSTPAIHNSSAVLNFADVSSFMSATQDTTSSYKTPASAKTVKGAKKQQLSSATISSSSSSSSSSFGPGSKSWLLQHRLVQMVYLDVMSYKSLKKQEEQAQIQLHALWEVCERQRREEAELKRAIEYEKRMQALDTAMEGQLQGLVPVCEQLHGIQSQYSTMSAALDTTRHELLMTGISPFDEDELLEEFNKLEVKLGEIMAEVREKVSQLSSVASSSNTLLKTLQKEYTELEGVREQLEGVVQAAVHEASLFFEKRQIQQTLAED